jgi:hypothetical protein
MGDGSPKISTLRQRCLDLLVDLAGLPPHNTPSPPNFEQYSSTATTSESREQIPNPINARSILAGLDDPLRDELERGRAMKAGKRLLLGDATDAAELRLEGEGEGEKGGEGSQQRCHGFKVVLLGADSVGKTSLCACE